MSMNKATLNVYQKVAIIRKADDVLSYEDSEGNVKTITDLHLAAAATVSRSFRSLLLLKVISFSNPAN